jgi:dihydroorotate dehydrogenase electron transfer subunit
VILGARDRAHLFGRGALEQLGVPLTLATDAGDEGFAGNAVQALEARLGSGPRPALVYGCGPEPMLAALVALTRRHGLRCEVSLERRMACGFGVCYTCVCPVRGENGVVRNVRTCLDGPVLDANKLPEGALCR